MRQPHSPPHGKVMIVLVFKYLLSVNLGLKCSESLLYEFAAKLLFLILIKSRVAQRMRDSDSRHDPVGAYCH